MLKIPISLITAGGIPSAIACRQLTSELLVNRPGPEPMRSRAATFSSGQIGSVSQQFKQRGAHWPTECRMVCTAF